MKYYVYEHIRLDTNTPFYVGKGSGKRAFSNYSRNTYWRNIVEKHGYEVRIVEYFEKEEKAFEKEVELISLNKSKGYCEANFCKGGQGNSSPMHANTRKALLKSIIGRKVSKETRKKIRDGNLGKIISKETRLKLSQIKKGGRSPRKGAKLNKSVRNKMAISSGAKEFEVLTKKGVLIGKYLNQNQCARELGLSVGNVNMCLKGKRRTHKGYVFKYKEIL